MKLASGEFAKLALPLMVPPGFMGAPVLGAMAGSIGATFAPGLAAAAMSPRGYRELGSAAAFMSPGSAIGAVGGGMAAGPAGALYGLAGGGLLDAGLGALVARSVRRSDAEMAARLYWPTMATRALGYAIPAALAAKGLYDAYGAYSGEKKASVGQLLGQIGAGTAAGVAAQGATLAALGFPPTRGAYGFSNSYAIPDLARVVGMALPAAAPGMPAAWLMGAGLSGMGALGDVAMTRAENTNLAVLRNKGLQVAGLAGAGVGLGALGAAGLYRYLRGSGTEKAAGPKDWLAGAARWLRGDPTAGAVADVVRNEQRIAVNDAARQNTELRTAPSEPGSYNTQRTLWPSGKAELSYEAESGQLPAAPPAAVTTEPASSAGLSPTPTVRRPGVMPLVDEYFYLGKEPKVITELKKTNSLRSGEFSKIAGILDSMPDFARTLGRGFAGAINSPAGTAAISALAGASAGNFFGARREREFTGGQLSHLLDPGSAIDSASPPPGVSALQYQSVVQDPVVRRVLEQSTRHRALTKLVDRYLSTG